MSTQYAQYVLLVLAGKFQPVLNFTQLHTLTLAASYYALLQAARVERVTM